MLLAIFVTVLLLNFAQLSLILAWLSRGVISNQKKIYMGGRGTLTYIFKYILARLWFGCIPKISFPHYLKVPQNYVLLVVSGEWVVERKFSYFLWL
jgi:hypothetical protein